MMLGLLTVLLGPIRPRILLMDDIEHGLHPLAQKIWSKCSSKSCRSSRTAIAGQAHSPYLLDYLDPSRFES